MEENIIRKLSDLKEIFLSKPKLSEEEQHVTYY